MELIFLQFKLGGLSLVVSEGWHKREKHVEII